MARAAEEVGFDSIWLGDHLLYRDEGRPERGPWDVWTLLAALAAATERVVLGPLVACLGFHPPGLIARMAAAIDEISGGRFVLGVGSGWNEPEFRAFGLPFDHRAIALHRELRDHPPAARRRARDERGHVLAGATTPCCSRRRRARRRSWSAASGRGSSPRRCPTSTAGTRGGTGTATRPRASRRATPQITAAAEAAGRDPAEVERSACVLVALRRRRRSERPGADIAAARGQPAIAWRGALHELAEAGADEAILVLDPDHRGERAAVRGECSRARRLSGYLPMPAVRPRTKKRWPER